MSVRAPLPELLDIDEVRPVDETDQVVFDEVREVLERHGALQRFGLTLLHKHFDISEDEVLVETIHADSRTLTLRPKELVDSGNAVETSWRLDDPVARQRCESMCIPIRGREGQVFHDRQHFTTS